MSQSLSKVYVHIIFSTKQRQPFITQSIQAQLYSYMAVVLNNYKSPAKIIGGMPDHVYTLCNLSKIYSVSKIVEMVKKRSSKWIKTKGHSFRQFSWQSGYAAFSVSQSQLNQVKAYITNQAKHHQKMTFKEELIIFLNKYQVKYDERYLWD